MTEEVSGMNNQQWLIFSDLDGSLLDHDNYCHKAADELLLELERDQVPVVLTTSKTGAEVISIREELNNCYPFIVENGAAIFIPHDYFLEKPIDCLEIDDYWVYSFSQSRSHWLVE